MSDAPWLSWIELDAAAFRHNIETFRARLAPATALLLVVKANAYGHGLTPIVELARGEAVDWLGVHSLSEGVAARDAGWSGPILVMGALAPGSLSAIVEHDLDVTVVDLDTVDLLDARGAATERAIRCHVEIETGTNRQGVLPEEIDAFLGRFHRARGVVLRGLSTHFANIEDTTDPSYARGQLARFAALAARVEASGRSDVVRHTACTAAILTLPETRFDLVRLGIGAYGIWPSRETRATLRLSEGEGIHLQPVLAWKTRIGQLKWIEGGEYVGYGCSVRTSRRTRLAVLPTGYADGYDRGLSSLAHTLVRGRRAPVLGRVCMNMTMIDVTDIEGVEPGDEVVLLGRDGDEEVSAERLGQWAQTIGYEIVARLSPSLPRIVVGSPQRTRLPGGTV